MPKSSAPGRVRTDTGVLLGDRPLPWATGAPNINPVWLSIRQNRSAPETRRLIQGRHRRVRRSRDAVPMVGRPRGAGHRHGRMSGLGTAWADGPDVRPGRRAGRRAGRREVARYGMQSEISGFNGIKRSGSIFMIAKTFLFAKTLCSYSVRSLPDHELTSARYPRGYHRRGGPQARARPE